MSLLNRQILSAAKDPLPKMGGGSFAALRIKKTK
jgi:hypothetical protein